MKNKLLLIAMGFALTAQMITAQIPSYVPTNGLVAYYPFNGNANDESGSGNNGTVNGATLTTDRLGASNTAYSFNGNGQYIQAPNKSLQGSVSFSGWYKMTTYNIGQNDIFFFANNSPSNSIVDCNFAAGYRYDAGTGQHGHCVYPRSSTNLTGYYALNQIPTANVWHHFVCVFNNGVSVKMYLDNNLFYTNTTVVSNTSLPSLPMLIGYAGQGYSFTGQLDDIGIWNRVLTEQEIANLYNSTSINTAECLTMTINTGVLSTTPVTYTSSVNIYPNPANDHITIDCGNLANVSGWSIKITNMLGQEVFNQPMNTQQYIVPLNSWTGQGMYFVKIINAQNEVVNIKKIILQ